MEIRQMDNADFSRALEFLSEDYLYNAEAIGIIEKIGLEGKFFRLYGLFKSDCEEDESKALIATVFVSRREGCLYFPSYCGREQNAFQSFFYMLKLMSRNLNLESLSVDFSIKEEICELFDIKSVQNQYLCVYNPCAEREIAQRFGNLEKEMREVQLLTEANQLQDLAELHFRSFGRGMNAWKYSNLIGQKLVRLYGIYIGMELACKGEWMCADPKIGYISGLCTDSNLRGLGLCSHLIREITREILDFGGIPVLSYEEESLRNFYDMLGFECMYIRSVLWLTI